MRNVMIQLICAFCLAFGVAAQAQQNDDRPIAPPEITVDSSMISHPFLYLTDSSLSMKGLKKLPDIIAGIPPGITIDTNSISHLLPDLASIDGGHAFFASPSVDPKMVIKADPSIDPKMVIWVGRDDQKGGNRVPAPAGHIKVTPSPEPDTWR